MSLKGKDLSQLSDASLTILLMFYGDNTLSSQDRLLLQNEITRRRDTTKDVKASD
jgi:hypothetical protein